MSIWTNVTGIVILEDRGLEPVPPNVGTFVDYLETPAKDNIRPCGSEGSLYATVSTAYTCPWSFVVNVHGALRDYDNPEEIAEYFKKITEGYRVSQGLFIISVDAWNNSYERTYMYVNKGWKRLDDHEIQMVQR